MVIIKFRPREAKTTKRGGQFMRKHLKAPRADWPLDSFGDGL